MLWRPILFNLSLEIKLRQTLKNVRFSKRNHTESDNIHNLSFQCVPLDS
jgi:hypothetical protein